MPAYVISEVECRDPALFDTYRRLAADSIAQFGGRYLVRGGASELVEGGPPPKALIVVEFPSMPVASKKWHTSPAYAMPSRSERKRSSAGSSSSRAFDGLVARRGGAAQAVVDGAAEAGLGDGHHGDARIFRAVERAQ